MQSLPSEIGYIGPPSFQKISLFFNLIQYSLNLTQWRVEIPPGPDFDVSFFDGAGGPIEVKGYNSAPQTLSLVCAANEKKLFNMENPNDQHPIIMSDRWWQTVFQNPGYILGRNFTVDRLYGRILAIEAGISFAKFANGSSVTVIIFGVWDNSLLLDCLTRCFSNASELSLLQSLLLQSRTPIALVPGRRPVGSFGLEARRGICVGR
jgi:hypothetical protein